MRRLTLRYMLAYIDGLLSPADAQEIGAKIDDSEMARNLLLRIRDVIKRIRLGAPSVSERGQWLDPNTVAEYLDYKLADDQVPDFEKVCFESDVQLAEVASCHQILSLVLDKPAEVDPASRQRMYDLPEKLASGEIDRPPAAPLPAPRPAVVAGSNGNEEEVEPPPKISRVPEYLRPQPMRRQSGGWRSALGLGVGVALVLLVLALIGKIRPREWFASTGEAPVADASMTEKEHEATAETEAETKTKESTASGKNGMGESKPEPKAQPKAEPVAEPKAEPKVEPEDAPGETPKVTMRPETPKPESGLRQPEGVLNPAPRPAAGVKPGTGERAAVLTSSEEILLRLHPSTGAWQRVTDQAVLAGQDRLLSLPTSQPTITLANQLQVKLIDVTGITLLPPDLEGLPGLSIEFGRVVLHPEGTAKPRLRLQIGERTGILSFADSESTLAIDVQRNDSNGADPEMEPGPLVADLYATLGRMLWESGSDRPVTLQAPIRATLGERSLDTVALQQFPRWVYEVKLPQIEERASSVMRKGLPVDRPVPIGLRELAQHRQKEVCWLALRCLAAVDDYDLLLEGLNNRDQRLEWKEYVEQLQLAVHRSPQSAGKVREAMQRLYGEDGIGLYEMLWKYREDQLTPADARQLVKYLDHDTLVFRVLAITNLFRITAMNMNYRAEDTDQKRKPSISKWKERLAAYPTLRPRPDEAKPAGRGEKGKPAKTVEPERAPLPPGDKPAKEEAPPAKEPSPKEEP